MFNITVKYYLFLTSRIKLLSFQWINLDVLPTEVKNLTEMCWLLEVCVLLFTFTAIESGTYSVFSVDADMYLDCRY